MEVDPQDWRQFIVSSKWSLSFGIHMYFLLVKVLVHDEPIEFISYQLLGCFLPTIL